MLIFNYVAHVFFKEVEMKKTAMPAVSYQQFSTLSMEAVVPP
jgi:hypothetical protein